MTHPAITTLRRSRWLLLGATVLLAHVMAGPSLALETVRAGKTASNALAFTPLEIGTAKGIWAKHDLKVDVLQYAGDAKMQQALVANEISFGLGSGPGMGFIAKNVPAKAVGVIADQPLSMGLIVSPSSSVKAIEDLKGKRVGITTNGSLTYWLARELSRKMGWGSEGIKTVALGSIAGQMAGLKSGQVDGFIMSASVGYMLAQKKEGEVLVNFGDMIPKFHTHVMFASNALISSKPEVVRGFLLGWKETIDWMLANKEEAIDLAHKVTGIPRDIQAAEFDKVMPMMSRDMRFNAEAMAAITDSFIEMGILDRKPDPATLYTEQFLPIAQ